MVKFLMDKPRSSTRRRSYLRREDLYVRTSTPQLNSENFEEKSPNDVPEGVENYDERSSIDDFNQNLPIQR